MPFRPVITLAEARTRVRSRGLDPPPAEPSVPCWHSARELCADHSGRLNCLLGTPAIPCSAPLEGRFVRSPHSDRGRTDASALPRLAENCFSWTRRDSYLVRRTVLNRFVQTLAAYEMVKQRLSTTQTLSRLMSAVARPALRVLTFRAMGWHSEGM